ncbi:MAG: DUF721 domain-containing protein [Nitrospirae bacterium]|nr:MAG: DUF721 domain-containing protein [Nitrospirota bacterium]
MKKVGPILNSIFENFGFEEKLKLEKMRTRWDRHFLEPMSLHTFPSDLNKGELLITVDSPVWLQQLTFFKNEIIAKLASYGVKAVRFRQGRIHQKEEKAAMRPTGKKRREPTEDEARWIEENVSTIKDPELADAFRSLIEKSIVG